MRAACWPRSRTAVRPRLLFPNARFVVGRRAWERARNPHPRDRASFIAALPALLEQSGRLELVDGARADVARRRGPVRVHRRPHAGPRARRDRRRRRRRVLLRPDPGSALGPRAGHDGLRPLSRAARRREEPRSSRTRSRAVCGSSSRMTSAARSRCRHATTRDATGSRPSERRSRRSRFKGSLRTRARAQTQQPSLLPTRSPRA